MSSRVETTQEFCERTLTHIYEGAPVDRWVVQELPPGSTTYRPIETIYRETIAAPGHKPTADQLHNAIERAIINADASKARVQAWVPHITRNQVAQKVWPQLAETGDGTDQVPSTDPLAILGQMFQQQMNWNTFLMNRLEAMNDSNNRGYADRLNYQNQELIEYRNRADELRRMVNEMQDRTADRELSKIKTTGAIDIGRSIVGAVSARWLGAAGNDRALDESLRSFARTLSPEQIRGIQANLSPAQQVALFSLLVDDERERKRNEGPLAPTKAELRAARASLPPEEYRKYLDMRRRTLAAAQLPQGAA